MFPTNPSIPAKKKKKRLIYAHLAPRLKVEYLKALDWTDTVTHLTIGTQFVFKVTSADPVSAHAELYVYADCYTPIITSTQAQNASAVYLSGHGLILSDDDAGLKYWSELVTKVIGAQTKPTYLDQGMGGKRKALDVMWVDSLKSPDEENEKEG